MTLEMLTKLFWGLLLIEGVFLSVIFYWLYQMERAQQKIITENRQLRKDLDELCCDHNDLLRDLRHLHGTAYRGAVARNKGTE